MTAIHLRPATPDDAELLLAWRNDELTRRWSFSSTPVAREEHVAWLGRRLGDPGTRLWVALHEHIPVGTVRAQRGTAGQAELHLALAPEARGRRLATPIVDAAARAAGRELGVRALVARVVAGNVASERAFRAGGFEGPAGELRRALVPEPVVAIVQARMGSTRLPGKVLAEVAGRPMLALLLERLARATTVDATWVATTDLARDDPIVALAEGVGTPVVRGDERDVLKRFALAADAAGAGTVVRVTADCPFLDPAGVDGVVGLLGGTGASLATNAPPRGRTWPDGTDAEALTTATLRAMDAAATDPADREHVTRWLHRRPGADVAVLDRRPPAGEVRVTVDTAEDLQRVRALAERLGRRDLVEADVETVLAALSDILPA